MFGYIQVNCKALTEENRQRYRACYCGLCHVLKARFGNVGRLTLSNDMTFLMLLLSSLYEPDETCYDERCILHPTKKHRAIVSKAAEYAADMNVLLAYHKCLDDIADEGSLRGRAGEMALRRAYRKVHARYPQKCEKVKGILEKIADLEKANTDDIDAITRLSGQMLAETFAWKDDVFAPYLRDIGMSLGSFIYLMDAFEDYDGDIRRGRYNPLIKKDNQQDYKACMEDILTMLMAKSMRAFDCLPLERDVQLLKNILYSGVWNKYAWLLKH